EGAAPAELVHLVGAVGLRDLGLREALLEPRDPRLKPVLLLARHAVVGALVDVGLGRRRMTELFRGLATAVGSKPVELGLEPREPCRSDQRVVHRLSLPVAATLACDRRPRYRVTGPFPNGVKTGSRSARAAATLPAVSGTLVCGVVDSDGGLAAARLAAALATR